MDEAVAAERLGPRGMRALELAQGGHPVAGGGQCQFDDSRWADVAAVGMVACELLDPGHVGKLPQRPADIASFHRLHRSGGRDRNHAGNRNCEVPEPQQSIVFALNHY
jgi:hypothetical protein